MSATANTIQSGIYRHYKGQLYQVFNVATHSETEEKMVVYQCLYGNYDLWVRPLSMFVEDITLADGTKQPRFAFISSSLSN